MTSPFAKRVRSLVATALVALFLLASLARPVGAQPPTFVWAGQMGGTLYEEATGIAVDGSGSVYTTGHFSGTTDFDPGVGVFNLTAGAFFRDIFVSKLDSAGNFVWARQMGGGLGGNQGAAIAVDGSGNVYTTGNFQGTVDFDPGVGVFNLTSLGSIDIFVSKLDSAGNFVWARRMGGGPGFAFGYGIAVDGSGNVYTTGSFQTTVDFDPGVGVFSLSSLQSTIDIFVSKLDSAGNFVWARQMGGAPFHEQGFGIAVDGSGNVYTTGYFSGIVDFNPGAGVFNLGSIGAIYIFVSKLDSAGNFVWARQMGSTAGNNLGSAIAVDASGNVYTTGDFFGTVDFDPGVGVFNLTSLGGIDIFVSKLDSAGNFVWARQMGGVPGNDQGTGIALDGSGNVYTTGHFGGTADFDPGVGVFNLTSFGFIDIFVSKLDSAGNFVWASQMGGTSNSSLARGYGIAVDGSQIVYTTGHFQSTVDFDPGVGVFNLTSLGFSDIFVSKLAEIPCLTAICVSGTQPFPGAPVYVNNGNLTPGNEYFNIFSFDLCPGGVGTGPFGGLCVSSPANHQFVLTQLTWPLGSSLLPLFHFTAPSSYVNWGPLTVPPVTLEAITFDFTGGVLGAISQVATITVQ